MEKTHIKKNQLIEATKNIPSVAEREGWVLTLDKEEGALFYSPEKISDQAELYQITDEYSLYLNKDLKPEGLMIEYFKENFLKHREPLIKKLSQKIFSGRGNVVVAKLESDKKNGEVAIIAKFLESNLIKEASKKFVSS